MAFNPREVAQEFIEFDHHGMVIHVSDNKTRLEGFIAVHRGTLEKPAFGATRIVAYKTKEEALRDALTLSRVMSYKMALANLPYGGAKGVIILPPDLSSSGRRKLFENYVEQVNSLKGHFITGADVGITRSDLLAMRKRSAYIEGVKSNPVKFTAMGLLIGIEVALEEVFGNSDLSRRTFAIQGVGKIGGALLKLIYRRAKKVYVADLDNERLNEIIGKFPNVEVVGAEVIHKQTVDVFSPCGLGNSLTARTVSEIRSAVIVGGANNQLESGLVGELLHDRGILYGPDYVVNAGGVISVVDQYENKRFDATRIEGRLNSIRIIFRDLIRKSKTEKKPLNIAADRAAELIFNNY